MWRPVSCLSQRTLISAHPRPSPAATILTGHLASPPVKSPALVLPASKRQERTAAPPPGWGSTMGLSTLAATLGFIQFWTSDDRAPKSASALLAAARLAPGGYAFVDGAWLPVADQQPKIYAASEEVIGVTPLAPPHVADLAVQAARRAFDTGPWPRMTPAQRGVVLHALADALLQNVERLATLETLDMGKLLAEARADIRETAKYFCYCADLAIAQSADARRAVALNYSLPETPDAACIAVDPVGVVLAVTPFNYPLLMAVMKVAPALAAGCPVVLKPSEYASLSSLELAVLAQQVGLPRGVLNVVPGLGATVGAVLSSHPDVDHIRFTGSVATGKKVAHAAVDNMKSFGLELGGKSPLLVFEDADLDVAVEQIIAGIFYNAGQVCSAFSNLLVHDKVKDALLQRLLPRVATLEAGCGDGLSGDSTMAPLVNKTQYDAVMADIARAKQEGAKVLCGGGRPPHLSKGYFVAPTILEVTDSMTIVGKEVFGPVLTVRTFAHEKEALQRANRNVYGLAGAVISRDAARRQRVMNALRVGVASGNATNVAYVELPWSGHGLSGNGLGELGPNALAGYQVQKAMIDRP